MPYPHGHQDLRNGVHVWLQPDGGWGRSNAGLVVGDGVSLLVDTLFDLRLTREMLAGFAPVTRSAPITTVVNTHGNGDHWFGNGALPGVEIIASAAAAAEMRDVGPEQVRALMRDPGPAGGFVRRVFEPFDLDGLAPVYPTRVFERELTLTVGGVTVRLVDVGPAHSAGDTIVHVPAAGVVFTGDIVFAGRTPVVWHGPMVSWVRACDLLLGLDADTIVPGHGPVATEAAVRETRDYLMFVTGAAAARYAEGMSAEEAARDIDLGRYAALGERERLAANVRAVYRDLGASDMRLDGPAMFACMAEFVNQGIPSRFPPRSEA